MECTRKPSATGIPKCSPGIVLRNPLRVEQLEKWHCLRVGEEWYNTLGKRA
jgi:hypothetical protein